MKYEILSTALTHVRPMAGPQETPDGETLRTLATEGQNPTVVAEKPRRGRKRKEVTADKFIIVRVTQEMYDSVQFGADLAGETLSTWVRKALEAKLS